MKDFLELLKSPQDAMKYILNNFVKGIINLMEYLGLNVLKGFANFVSNLFYVVPENTFDDLSQKLDETLNKEKFDSKKENDKQTDNKINFQQLNKLVKKRASEPLSFTENDYSDNLIESKIAVEGAVYPNNYLFENESRNLKLKQANDRKSFVCNNKDLYYWKNTSYINRPWYEECDRGYCLNYQIDDFDEVEASEDNSFRATI